LISDSKHLCSKIASINGQKYIDFFFAAMFADSPQQQVAVQLAVAHTETDTPLKAKQSNSSVTENGTYLCKMKRRKEKTA